MTQCLDFQPLSFLDNINIITLQRYGQSHFETMQGFVVGQLRVIFEVTFSVDLHSSTFGTLFLFRIYFPGHQMEFSNNCK